MVLPHHKILWIYGMSHMLSHFSQVCHASYVLVISWNHNVMSCHISSYHVIRIAVVLWVVIFISCTFTYVQVGVCGMSCCVMSCHCISSYHLLPKTPPATTTFVPICVECGGYVRKSLMMRMDVCLHGWIWCMMYGVYDVWCIWCLMSHVWWYLGRESFCCHGIIC